MPKKSLKRVFTQHAKPLNTSSETINSLAFLSEPISSLASVKITKGELFTQKIISTVKAINSLLMDNGIKKNLRWAFFSLAASVTCGIFIFQLPIYTVNYAKPTRYAVYSSKPLTLETVQQEFNLIDSRAEKINSVFASFNCPLYGTGEEFVLRADENDIPYWLAAAIAFQESSCAKNTPFLNGQRTKNAWGYATYGSQVYDFDSYEQGIDVVSRYLNKRFYSRGITDLCEIMRVYTPPSNGSWCSGVGYFRDYILNYKTPLTTNL